MVVRDPSPTSADPPTAPAPTPSSIVDGKAGAAVIGAQAVRSVWRTVLFEGRSVPGWHERAACASMPTSLFFPEVGGTREARTVRAAKRVCAGCAVREQCLADVMAYESRSHQRHGVAGGTSAGQRSRLGRSVGKGWLPETAPPAATTSAARPTR